MIPIELQRGLKKRADEVFSGTWFKNPNSELGTESVPLTVFEQNLPNKSKEDISFFPFLIVKLLDGEQKGEQNPHFVNVGFVIGVFDEDLENQGYRDVTIIINKLFENLSKYPLIDDRFELSRPIKWRIHEEETDPYYFGVVETTWTVPVYSRSDVEGLV